MMYVALSYDHSIVDGREAVILPRADQGVRRGAFPDIVRCLSKPEYHPNNAVVACAIRVSPGNDQNDTKLVFSKIRLLPE